MRCAETKAHGRRNCKRFPSIGDLKSHFQSGGRSITRKRTIFTIRWAAFSLTTPTILNYRSRNLLLRAGTSAWNGIGKKCDGKNSAGGERRIERLDKFTCR